MSKFLFVNPFGIGDVLFTTPIVRAIKDSQPDSVICYWCNERAKDILKNNPDINKIFALSRGDLKKVYHRSVWQGACQSLKLLSEIKKERFDTSLDFSLDYRYSLITKIIGIRKRVGFNYKHRGRFLTDKIDIDGYSDKHVVEYYLDLLMFIGVKPKNYNLELAISQDSERKIKEVLKEAGINDKDLIIGISPGAGASWGKDALLKHWPAISFGLLADRIIDKFGAKVIILGDAQEMPIAGTMIDNMHKKALGLVGKTSLEELSALINRLQILITNDGGPLHIAVALGKKTLSFFGPVDPKVYGPYPPDEKRHIVLRKEIDCSPCYSKFRLRPCARDKECLRAINVEEALEAVNRLLG